LHSKHHLENGQHLLDYFADAQTPEQHHQIHYQADGSDPGFGGLGRLGTDVIGSITVLALAELSFDRNALQAILSALRRIEL